MLTVDCTLLQLGGKLTVGTPKTRPASAGSTSAPPPPRCCASTAPPSYGTRMAAGPGWEDHDLIFCRDDGGRAATSQTESYVLRTGGTS